MVSWDVHLWMLVAVLVYAPPSGNAGSLREEVQAALAKAAGVSGTSPTTSVDEHALREAIAERLAGWVRADELGFFERARAKAEEGRRLLDRVELEAADAAFAEAERIYEAQLARPGVAALWSQAALWRGVAVFERGQSALARKLFRRAVALDPTARLTEASTRPEVVRAFVDAIRAHKMVKLTLRSGDSAELLVDGKAPPPSGEVTAGEHVVTARAVGRLPLAVLADDEDGLELELMPPPDALLDALDSLRRAPNSDGLAALASARALDASVVTALAIDNGELVLVGERVDARGCASSLATATAKVTLDGSAAGRAASVERAAATLLERLAHEEPKCPGSPEAVLAAPQIAHPRAAPAVIVSAAEKPPLPSQKKPKRAWERPWLWLGLLAVTTAGIAVAAALAPSQVSYKASVDGANFSVTTR